MLQSRRILDLAAYLRKNPLVRTLFVALGFTSIYLMWVVKPAVEPSQYIFYHWSGPPRNFFMPVVLYFFALWLLLILLLLLVRKPSRIRVAIWSALILFIPCVLLKMNIFYHRFGSVDLPSVAFVCAALATLLITAMWRPGLNERFERVLAPITTILIFMGIFGVFLLCNLSWYGWQGHAHYERSAPRHQQASATIQPHRVIWILFDELSYQQVYEHRFPGLQLPAFDALAKQATVFTDVVPPDIYTEVVLPGLLIGEPFDKIQTSANREPSLHNSTSGRWQRFNQYDTAFQDALDAGYSTAVAGWYNPYCRILSGVLDKCFWIDLLDNPVNAMLASGTVVSNSLALGKSMVTTFIALTPSWMQIYLTNHLHIHAETGTPEMQTAEMHIKDYGALNAASDKLLRDRSAGFVLLHLPVPHPPGIYDRKTSELTTHGGSYIDNLALADRCLTGLWATLEQTGQWDSSTIVIMGDHSWRTEQVWKHQKGWSQEDEDASHGGQYDPRPAYIVKLPGQTVGSRIDTPFHSMNTRKLFDAIFMHKINTSADLSAWARSTQ